MIRFAALCCFLGLLLVGCATQLVPDDFQGETATLRDSYGKYHDGGLFGPDSAEFFVASEVDGKPIDNALGETRRTNYGRGFSMTPVPYERRVPIRTMKVKLYGTVHYAADIAAMLNKTYETERVVAFTPEPGGRYVVRGKLGDQSRLWIEREDGTVITQ
jgi:hypothetical protein